MIMKEDSKIVNRFKVNNDRVSKSIS